MNHIALRYLLLFVLLIPAQALIFNHMVLFNVAVPLVFVYLLICLPVTVATNWAVALGFVTGLSVDIFSDTLGLNALTCTVLAFARKPIFHLYHSMDDDLAGRMPSAQTMGAPGFMKYSFTMSLGYCMVLFLTEAFQLFNLRLLGMRIVFSTIYTFVFIYVLNCFTLRQPTREKKL